MPVAVNCWVIPNAAEGLSGVIVIVESATGVMVIEVEPLMEPRVAVMVADATAPPVANPPAVMLAVLLFDELQVTELVRLLVLPSVYVPVAVNCCVVPSAIDGLTGVTAIETSAAAVTVKVVEPVTPPDAALIVVAPVATVFANPAAEIVATPVLEDVHVAELVRFPVVPSL